MSPVFGTLDHAVHLLHLRIELVVDQIQRLRILLNELIQFLLVDYFLFEDIGLDFRSSLFFGMYPAFLKLLQFVHCLRLVIFHLIIKIISTLLSTSFISDSRRNFSSWTSSNCLDQLSTSLATYSFASVWDYSMCFWQLFFEVIIRSSKFRISDFLVFTSSCNCSIFSRWTNNMSPV